MEHSIDRTYLGNGPHLGAVGEVSWLRAVGGVHWDNGGLVGWCLVLGGVGWGRVDWRWVVAEIVISNIFDGTIWDARDLDRRP